MIIPNTDKNKTGCFLISATLLIQLTLLFAFVNAMAQHHQIAVSQVDNILKNIRAPLFKKPLITLLHTGQWPMDKPIPKRYLTK